jgi:hypothetical protein
MGFLRTIAGAFVPGSAIAFFVGLFHLGSLLEIGGADGYILEGGL